MPGSQRSRKGARRRARWIAAALALAAAVLALWALRGGGGSGGGEPLDDIDPESRARLERVLREAEREGGR